MPCPFPGMDPYIERAELWPDFHHSLVVGISRALQPGLRPRYAALLQGRTFTEESDSPCQPDFYAPRADSRENPEDGPVIFPISREEIRQPYVTIVDLQADNRVVTAIEVLSPDNKDIGPGRKSYLSKREAHWSSSTNLVEIDLLRRGMSTVRVSAERLKGLEPWHYLVAVTRCSPSRREVYAVPLQRRLPRIAVPLQLDDRDVALDLQAVFTRCWETGPYPELLDYEGRSPPMLLPEEKAWVDEQLRQAGFRPERPT